MMMIIPPYVSRIVTPMFLLSLKSLPTFSFSSGVTWLVADFIFSKRARYPEHSAFSSWISDAISSVVRAPLSSFSSEGRRHGNVHVGQKQQYFEFISTLKTVP